MIDNALYQVRREGRGTISGLTLSTWAKPIGTAVMITGKDADTGINTFGLAEGRADGFLTQAVRLLPGMTDAEGFNASLGLTAGDDGDFQGHSVAGGAASADLPAELEVEGSDYVLGSSGSAITADTAVGTKLSFDQGRFSVAATGEFAQYRLVKVMTPVTSGNVRIYVQEIEGYLVP
jgi:hypothetical protein